MAIKITENGTVNYENENDVNRTLFPNEPNTKEITKKLSIIENKLRISSDDRAEERILETDDDLNTALWEVFGIKISGE